MDTENIFAPEEYELEAEPFNRLFDILISGFLRVGKKKVPIEVRKVLPEDIVTFHARVKLHTGDRGAIGYYGKPGCQPELLRTNDPAFIESEKDWISSAEYMVHDNTIVLDHYPKDEGVNVRITICHPAFRPNPTPGAEEEFPEDTLMTLADFFAAIDEYEEVRELVTA